MLTTQKRETIVVYRIDTQHGVAVRTAPINLRALPAQRDLIDQAAAAQGKSRCDFMLEAACAPCWFMRWTNVPRRSIGTTGSYLPPCTGGR